MKGIETRVREGKQEVSFKISAMPMEHFLRFKRMADEEWGSSYWHTIKFLMDWYEKTTKIFEMQDSESQNKIQENDESSDVKFLGQ